MSWIRASRAIGGLLSIITLLTLLVADFALEQTLTTSTLLLLLAMISALLGVDILREKLPIEIRIREPPGDDREP